MKRMVQVVLFTALLAAVTLGLPHGAQASGFNPEFSITLTHYEHDANADWTITFTIADTDINYAELVAFYPAEFFPADSGVPLGAKVGKEDPTTTLGLLNGPCSVPLGPHFDLYWASTDTSSTVTFSEQFEDSNGDGLHDGIDQYPDFLIRMLPSMKPVQRMYGDANMSGSLVSINFVILEAGALEAYPSAWGWPLVVVVNNMGDPAAEPTPGEAITDFCTPLSSSIGFFALSEDNPATGANEAGYEVRRNPPYGGSYTFRWHLESMRDADGDGIENYLDTCPFDVNSDNSPKVDTGPDNDGIDSACDADPAAACWPDAPGLSNDCDGDGFYNRGDNCPLVANGDQADADTDNIGDACDPNPTTADGSFEEKTIEIPVEISGPSPPALGEETATPTPTPTATPLAAESPTSTLAVETVTPTTIAPSAGGAGYGSGRSWPWWPLAVAGVAVGAAGVLLAYQGRKAKP